MLLLGLLMPVIGLMLLSSVTAWSCSAGSNVTMVNVEDPNFAPQLGAADLLKIGGRAQPWPRANTPTAVMSQVRYCFVSEAVKAKLGCTLQDAITTWSNSLGVGWKENGHSVAFIEANDGNKADRKFLSCYGADYRDFENPGTWNPAVKSYHLAIHGTEDGGNFATVGYRTLSMLTEHEEENGRHYMVLSNEAEVYQVVHEVSQVFPRVYMTDEDSWVTVSHP
jgi:hypothetical protein